jgi:predicted O-methyltransferase YrrM
MFKSIPTIFRQIPECLRVIDEPIDPSELSQANSVRKRFEMDDCRDPYMVDIVRAFRVVEGANVYIEVGTRDKGNIAWLSKKLAPNATVIDVDLDRFDEAERKLRNELVAIDYHCITGNSISSSTLKQINAVLNGRKADAIFCDSSHMYEHALAEFELYLPLLRSGGVLLFHDCFWEGNEMGKGKCQAMQAIDRFTPVYTVLEREPVHRFIPHPSKGDVWGGVSIIIKS